MKPLDSESRIVPEEVVDAAWEEIGGLSEEQGRQHMQRLSRKQPALLAFVSAFSQDLSQDAAELTIYMFVVVAHMFEMQFGTRVQEVGPKRIEAIYEDQIRMFEGLADNDEQRLERAAVAQGEKQPWVWKYVTEGLFEPDDPEVNLTEDDQGSVAMIMKTVIDALDSSVR
jgi:hypothetical protein